MNSYGNPPSYWLLPIAILFASAMFSVAKKCTQNWKAKLLKALAFLSMPLVMVLLAGLSAVTGMNFLVRSTAQSDYESPTYLIVMLLIPIILIFIWQKYTTPHNEGIPDGGTWYCDKLQLQLCFDDSGSSFIVKDQKTIPGRLEIKDESKYLYLIAHDPLEGCVFSGKFRSRTKNKMEIKNRSDDYIYSFVQIQ